MEIEKILDEYLEGKKKEERHARPIGYFYASEIGGCPRQVVLKIKHPEIKYTLDTLRNFFMGDLIHDSVQGIVKEVLATKFYESEPDRGIWAVESEKQITITDIDTDLVISGRVDLLVKDPLNPEKSFVVELKTIKDFFYKKKEKKPDEHHVDQITLYLRATKLKVGYIIYIEKKSMKTMTFRVEYDPRRFAEIMKKARELYADQKAGKLPARLSGFPKGWKCEWCIYNKICKGDGN